MRMCRHSITRMKRGADLKYLDQNPWYREPYEAALQLERDIPELKLQPGFHDGGPYTYMAHLKDIISATGNNITKNDSLLGRYTIPYTYLGFLCLVGGFDYGSVHLLCRDFEPHRFEVFHRPVYPGKDDSITNEEIHRIQLRLGDCDHGVYVFDDRWNNYLLEGYGHTTYFADCIGMLMHAMWRARENFNGRKL